MHSMRIWRVQPCIDYCVCSLCRWIDDKWDHMHCVLGWVIWQCHRYDFVVL